MERLTVLDGIGQNELARCFDCCIEKSGTNLENCGMCEHWQKVLDKLAAYEDTGLEPKDIAKAFTEESLVKLTARFLKTTPDRLLELVQADQDCRLVLLPCKTGDTVWFRTFTKNGAIDLGIQPHEVVGIRGYAIAKGEYTDVGLVPAQYGVSWFLTCEEAEAALTKDNLGT